MRVISVVIVCFLRIAYEVKTVSSTWNDSRIESLGVREILAHSSWDRSKGWVACDEAVAATVRDISSTSDDQDWACEWVYRDQGSKCQ